MLDLEPLGVRIIVKRVEVKTEDPEKTKGGIFIPQVYIEARKKELELERQKVTEGTVLAVGDAVEQVRKGDKVFFGRYSGCEIERHGEKYIIMNDEDVIARIRTPKKRANRKNKRSKNRES
jgi:chaperonin GroES